MIGYLLLVRRDGPTAMPWTVSRWTGRKDAYGRRLPSHAAARLFKTHKAALMFAVAHADTIRRTI